MVLFKLRKERVSGRRDWVNMLNIVKIYFFDKICYFFYYKS